MGRIDVVFGPAAVRDIKKMKRDAQQSIIKLAEVLREEMRPSGVEKIQGHPQFYRLRQGDYRIIYCPLSAERAVILVASDRRDAYRQIDTLDKKFAAAVRMIKAQKAARSR